MKIKKINISTKLCDLYGRDGYQSHIYVGDEYFYYFDENTEIFRKSHKHWNKLRVSYVRSGCMFYCFPDYPGIKEDFCPISCFMAGSLVVANLDPVKDLKGDLPNIDSDYAKIVYYFDDEHTIVNNWPNEKEIEVDDEELFAKFGNTKEWLSIRAIAEENNPYKTKDKDE